ATRGGAIRVPGETSPLASVVLHRQDAWLIVRTWRRLLSLARPGHLRGSRATRPQPHPEPHPNSGCTGRNFDRTGSISPACTRWYAEAPKPSPRSAQSGPEKRHTPPTLQETIMNLTRRDFVEQALMAATAALATGTGIQAMAAEDPPRQPVGPNDKIRVAVIGVNGQGGAHVGEWLRNPDVDLVAICDCD